MAWVSAWNIWYIRKFVLNLPSILFVFSFPVGGVQTPTEASGLLSERRPFHASLEQPTTAITCDATKQKAQQTTSQGGSRPLPLLSPKQSDRTDWRGNPEHASHQQAARGYHASLPELEMPAYRLLAKLQDAKPVRSVEFNPSGTLYAVGSNSGILRVCACPSEPLPDTHRYIQGQAPTSFTSS